jgi:GAF domain-containing protein
MSLDDSKSPNDEYANNAEIEALLSASRAFQVGLGLPETLFIIVKSVRDALGFNRAIISLVESESGSQVLRRYAKIGLSDDEFSKLHPTTPLETFMKLLTDEFRVGQTYYIPHTRKDLWAGSIDVNTAKLSYSGQLGKWHSEDLLLVPIRDEKDNLIGLLSVDDPVDQNIPSTRICKLLEIFANQAAFAIRSLLFVQSQHDDLLRKQAELRISRDITNQLGRIDRALLDSNETTESIFDLILKVALSLTGSDYVDVVQYDETREHLFIRRSTVSKLNEARREVGRDGIVGWVGDNGQAKLVEDTSSEPLFLELEIEGKNTRSEMAVPLFLGIAVEGVLNFESNTINNFDGKKLDMAQALATRVALALRYEQYARILQAFNDIGTSILDESADLQKTLDVILDKSLNLVRAKYGNILFKSEAFSETLTIQTTTGDKEKYMGLELDIKNSISGLPMLEGRSVRIPNVEVHPLYKRVLTEEYMRSELVVCLFDGSECMGVINVESPNLDAFTAGDERMLEIMADQASIAIRIAKNQTEMSLLSEIDKGILSSTNLYDLLYFILNESLKVTGALHGNILEVDGDDLVILQSTGDSSRIGTRLPITDSVSGWPVLNNQALLISDLTEEPWRSLYRWVLQEEKMSSELVVPLMDEGKPIGVLNLESPKLNAFTIHHQDLLQAVANQAAVAFKMQKTRDRLALQESINEGVIETNEIMHAIGNLIDPIKFPLELIVRTKKLDVSTKGNIERALQAVEELYNLKEELLTPVRELYLIPLIPEEIIQEAIDRLDEVMRNDKVSLNVLLEDMPLILADKRALINVLVNLISNAIDSMSEKEKKIIVVRGYKETMSKMIRIDIEDSGCGIAASIMDDIWRPLFTKKASKKGTGLGLYTCKRLIVRMKGEIFVDKTELGVGTVFGLRLRSV